MEKLNKGADYFHRLKLSEDHAEQIRKIGETCFNGTVVIDFGEIFGFDSANRFILFTFKDGEVVNELTKSVKENFFR